jgi:hypothetical protein
MPDTISSVRGVPALFCDPRGPKLRDDRDATEVIGEAFSRQVDLVVLPVERLAEEFFQLSTGVAGEILQKFVLYGLRLAIVGDITRQLEASRALRDLVRESNRGRHVRFLADMGQLDLDNR